MQEKNEQFTTSYVHKKIPVKVLTFHLNARRKLDVGTIFWLPLEAAFTKNLKAAFSNVMESLGQAATNLANLTSSQKRKVKTHSLLQHAAQAKKHPEIKRSRKTITRIPFLVLGTSQILEKGKNTHKS